MINHFQAPFFVIPSICSIASQVIKRMGGWNQIQIWEHEKLPDRYLNASKNLQMGRENIYIVRATTFLAKDNI